MWLWRPYIINIHVLCTGAMTNILIWFIGRIIRYISETVQRQENLAGDTSSGLWNHWGVSYWPTTGTNHTATSFWLWMLTSDVLLVYGGNFVLYMRQSAETSLANMLNKLSCHIKTLTLVRPGQSRTRQRITHIVYQKISGSTTMWLRMTTVSPCSGSRLKKIAYSNRTSRQEKGKLTVK